MLYEISEVTPAQDPAWKPDQLACQLLDYEAQIHKLDQVVRNPAWRMDLQYLSAYVDRGLQRALEQRKPDVGVADASVPVPELFWSLEGQRRSLWKLARHPRPRSALTEESPIAVLMDQELQIGIVGRPPAEDSASLSTDSFFQPQMSIPVPYDPFGQWRQLAWSHDGRYMAVGFSDGSIQIVSADPLSDKAPLRITIRSVFEGHSEGAADSGPPSPISPAIATFGMQAWALVREKFWTAVGETSNKRIDPYASLLFLDPKPYGRHMMDGSSYDYELLSVGFDGIIRSYLLRLNDFDPEDFRQERSIGREQRAPGNCASFHHRVSLSNFYACITWAAFDLEQSCLYLGGKSKNKRADKNAVHMIPPITRWKLLPKSPYYALVDQEGLSFAKKIVLLEGEESQRPREIGRPRNSCWDFLPALLFWEHSKKHPLDFFARSCDVSPDGSRILMVTFQGELFLWNCSEQVTMDTIQRKWTAADILDIFEVQLSERTSRVTPQLLDARWWTTDLVFLCLEDGRVTAISVQSDSAPTHPIDVIRDFYKHSPVSMRLHDKICILEMETTLYKVHAKRNFFRRWLPSEERAEFLDTNWMKIVKKEPPQSWLSLSFALSLAIRPIRYFTDTFLWNFDDSSNASQPDHVLAARSFGLRILRETNPQELYLHRIRSRKYKEALELATLYNLSTDDVYKAQWIDSVVSEVSLRDLFDNIQDRSWKLNHCLSKIADTLLEQRLLYEHGIFMTNILPELLGDKAPLDTWEETFRNVRLTEEQSEVLFFRVQYLQLLDRLTSFEVIHQVHIAHPQFPFRDSYAHFRDVVLPVQAVEYARAGLMDALETVFMNQYEEVFPYRFAILESISETVSPQSYQNLLPAVQDGMEQPMRQKPLRVPDWCECPALLSQLPTTIDGSFAFNGVDLEKRELFMDQDFLKDWYIRRALALEQWSGCISQSLEMVVVAQAKSIPGLEAIHQHLKRLCDFVYDPVAVELNMPVIQLDLPALLRTEGEEILKIFLRRSVSLLDDEDIGYRMLAHDLSQHILPFLQQRDNPTLLPSLLKDLQKRSEIDLQWCLTLVQAVAAGKSDAASLNLPLLAPFGLECIFTTSRADQWDIVHRIAQILGPHSIERQRFETLKNYEEAATVLHGYNLDYTPKQFQDLHDNRPAQERLLIKLGRVQPFHKIIAHRGSAPSTSEEDRVQLLLDAMLKIQLRVCPLLSTEKIYQDFVMGLLTCGRDTFFPFVRDLLFPEIGRKHAAVAKASGKRPVPLEVVEDVIIKAAREYTENADSGARDNASLQLARDCLKIVPVQLFPTDTSLVRSVQRELEFMEACSDLCLQVGDLLPVQVLNHPHRMELVFAAIRQSPFLFKEWKTVVELTRRLHGGKECDVMQKAELLERMVDAAIGRGEFEHAYRLCMELVKLASIDAKMAGKAMAGLNTEETSPQVSRSVCTSCYRVAEERQYSDLAKKRELIGHALALANNASFSSLDETKSATINGRPVLDLWRSMEQMEASQWIAENLGLHDRQPVEMVESTLRDIRSPSLFETASKVHRLPRDLFYSGLSPLTRVDPKWIHRNHEQQLDLIMNEEQASIDILVGSKFLETKKTMLEGAVALLGDDFVYGSAYMFPRREYVEELLAKLPENSQNQLGAYLLALMQLASSLKAPSHASNPLFSQTAVKIIEKACLENPSILLSRYRKSVAQEHQKTVLKLVYRDEGIDSEKFQHDLEYRKQTVFNLVQTLDASQVQRAISLAKSNQISVAEVLAKHLVWLLFQHTRCTDAEWLESLQKWGPQIHAESAAILDIVAANLSSTEYQNANPVLTRVFALICDYHSNLDVKLQMSLRREILAQLPDSISLLELLLLRYGYAMEPLKGNLVRQSVGVFVQERKVLKDQAGTEWAAQLMGRLGTLCFLSWIPCEQEWITRIRHVSNLDVDQILSLVEIPTASQVRYQFIESRLSGVFGAHGNFSEWLQYVVLLDKPEKEALVVATFAAIRVLLLEGKVENAILQATMQFSEFMEGKTEDDQFLMNWRLFAYLCMQLMEQAGQPWVVRTMPKLLSLLENRSVQEAEPFAVELITTGTAMPVLLLVHDFLRNLHESLPTVVELHQRAVVETLQATQESNGRIRLPGLEIICRTIVQVEEEFPELKIADMVTASIAPLGSAVQVAALSVVEKYFTLAEDVAANLERMRTEETIRRMWTDISASEIRILGNPADAIEETIAFIGRVNTLPQALYLLDRLLAVAEASADGESWKRLWRAFFLQVVSVGDEFLAAVLACHLRQRSLLDELEEQRLFEDCKMVNPDLGNILACVSRYPSISCRSVESTSLLFALLRIATNTGSPSTNIEKVLDAWLVPSMEPVYHLLMIRYICDTILAKRYTEASHLACKYAGLPATLETLPRQWRTLRTVLIRCRKLVDQWSLNVTVVSLPDIMRNAYRPDDEDLSVLPMMIDKFVLPMLFRVSQESSMLAIHVEQCLLELDGARI